jgi:hypothetical protein
MADCFCSLSNVEVHTDRLLVKFSTSPYDKHDLEYMLNVVKEIEGEESSSCLGIALISRM